MNWRDEIKLIIHVADYGAHGKNYSNSDDYHPDLGSELPPLIKGCVDKKIWIIGFQITNQAELSFQQCKKDYEQYDINKKGLYIIEKYNEAISDYSYFKNKVIKAIEEAAKF